MIFKKKHLKDYLILLIFIILSFISSIVLFRTNDLFGAGDMQFHLKRIAELETSFKHGNLLPLFSFNQFHGSAVLTLYPYLNLIPIILLSVFIKSNITLIYVFFELNILLSLIVSYYSSLSLSKSRETSLLFAITYSLSTPFLTYGFYNMDLGVLTSIAIFPLVIFGFFNLIKQNRWLELSIGMTLLIYSHVLSTVIITGLLLLLLFINLLNNYKQLMTKYFWMVLFKAVGLSILLTSIIWIPIFKFGLNNFGNTYPPILINLNKIYFTQVFNYGIKGYITYTLGIMAIIGTILPIIYKIYRIITRNRRKSFNTYTKQMYGIAIFVILICRFFPWNLTTHGILKIFMIFQFTWRFYIIPELFLSYVFAVCIVKCIRHKLFRRLLFIFCIVVAIGFQFLGQGRLIHESVHSPLITRDYVIRNTYKKKTNVHHLMLSLKQFHFSYYKNPRYPYYKVINEKQLHRLINTYTDENTPDYYPIKSLPKVNYINNNEATYDHDRTINVKHTGYNRFSFDSPKKINRLALPLLHYNGEHLRVYVNHHLVHSHANGDSLVTLDNVKKGRSVVGVKYVPIRWVMVSKVILFMLGVIWIMGHFINVKFRNMNIDEKIAAIILGVILISSVWYGIDTGQWYDTLSSILISLLFYFLELGTDGPTKELLELLFNSQVINSINKIQDDEDDGYDNNRMDDALIRNDFSQYFYLINSWSRKVNLYMTKGQTQDLAKQLPHFDKFEGFMKTYTKAKNAGFNGLRAVNHVDEAERLMERIK